MLTSISTMNTLLAQDYTRNDEEEKDKSASFIRGGISDVTGFVAYEYFTENMSFSVGWHQYTADFTDASKPSIDFGFSFYGNPYYENSWYVSIGYASANAVQRTQEWYNNEQTKDELEWSGTWSFIGGYRFGGDALDLKVGAGYLTSDFISGMAIDLTMGLKLGSN